MDDFDKIDRVPTYINGFDDEMEGGIPRGYVTLISGSPGTMKSSIAYNILYYNALKRGVKGLFITLEQSRSNLLQHTKHLGMDFEKVKDLVSIVDLGYIRKNVKTIEDKKHMVDIIKTYAQNLKEATDYDIIALDSLPVLNIISDLTDNREELFEFFEWFRDFDVTAFIISEASLDPKLVRNEDFLADGIIHLKMEQVQDVNIQRRIRCVKMRATRNSPHYYTLLFSEGEFQATRVISER